MVMNQTYRIDRYVAARKKLRNAQAALQKAESEYYKSARLLMGNRNGSNAPLTRAQTNMINRLIENERRARMASRVLGRFGVHGLLANRVLSNV